MNFAFSDMIPGKISTFKILSFWDQHFKKNKYQKTIKYRFLAISSDLLKFCPENLQYIEEVPIKYPKQFICYIWKDM